MECQCITGFSKYNLHCLYYFSNIIIISLSVFHLYKQRVWSMGDDRTRNEIQNQMKKVCTVDVMLLCAVCCVLCIWKYFHKIIQQSHFVPFNVVYRCVRDCKWNCEKSKLKTIQFLCQTNKWISPFLFFFFDSSITSSSFFTSSSALLHLFQLLYICLRSPVFYTVCRFPFFESWIRPRYEQ